MNATKPLRRARTLVLAGSVAVVTLMTAGGSAHAQYPPQPPVGGTSITMDLTPGCQGPERTVEFLIKPVGFSTNGPATLDVRNQSGAVVDSFTSGTLSGSFPYPGEAISVTAHVNPSITQSFVYPASMTCVASSPPAVQASEASLPMTGSSGTSTTLLAAGLALLAGLGITAGTKVSQRRHTA